MQHWLWIQRCRKTDGLNERLIKKNAKERATLKVECLVAFKP